MNPFRLTEFTIVILLRLKNFMMTNGISSKIMLRSKMWVWLHKCSFLGCLVTLTLVCNLVFVL